MYLRWLVVLTLTLKCMSLATADQQVDYKRQVGVIGEQISKISRRLNANQALLKTEREKLLAVEQNIRVLTEQLAETESEINKRQQLVRDFKQQVQALYMQTEADRQALAELIRQRYVQGKPNYLKMLLNQENPYAVGRLQNYYGFFSSAQQQKLTAIAGELEQLTIVREEQNRLIAELLRQQKRQSKQQAELDQAKAHRRDSVDKLASKVDQNADKLKQLKQDRARLTGLLKQIAAQAAQLRQLQQKKLEQDRLRQAQGQAPVKSPARPLVEGGFRRQQGRLLAPVKGTQKYQFGSRLIESGMRAEGMFFNTQGSVEVRSIFRGRVLFADFLKGYGLLLIIDHGDDHISLYGHNELLYGKVGDMVETNEVVARSGVTGGLRSPGLYFEIRENAAPVDPAKWCQL